MYKIFQRGSHSLKRIISQLQAWRACGDRSGDHELAVLSFGMVPLE